MGLLLFVRPITNCGVRRSWHVIDLGVGGFLTWHPFLEFMVRKLIQLVALIGLLASGAWLWFQPGLEPLATLIASAGTLLGALVTNDGTLEHLQKWNLRGGLAKLRDMTLQRLLGKRYRPMHPEAELRFFWPTSGEVRDHRIIARRLGGDRGLDSIAVLTHFGPHIDAYDFLVFDGHTIELFCEDFDGDKKPEIAVTYHCGAHSMGFQLFRLDELGILAPVAGSAIGSDWPEILWRDEDRDGKLELYAKSRNWSCSPTQEFIDNRYILKGESYVQDSAY